ncbi:methionine aminopeptidase [Martensiomyces pterosporus]|nr:methionine aminopeptidase [Martensiomyces pterosporus]
MPARTALNRTARLVSYSQQQNSRRLLSTSAAVSQPRLSLRSLLQRQQHGAVRENRFGQYSRLVPASLAARKPEPREPSFDSVPHHIPRPPYAATGTPPHWQCQIPILTAEEIERMRTASKVARDALALGGSMVRPGVTTEEIDDEVHRFIVSRGGYPSCLNYMGFPKAICTSVNNVIAHGIPDSRKLADGDFINIDVTVYKDGFHGDTSATFAVGQVDEAGRDLMAATKESLDLAIQACGPGVPFSRIGETISSFILPLGYSISEELTGHGLGCNFHQNPLIYHHFNEEPGVMQPGMAFTIEPIVCQGVPTGIQWPDGWTISTEDGGRSAQYEHSLVVTENGVDVLTE